MVLFLFFVLSVFFPLSFWEGGGKGGSSSRFAGEGGAVDEGKSFGEGEVQNTVKYRYSRGEVEGFCVMSYF